MSNSLLPDPSSASHAAGRTCPVCLPDRCWSVFLSSLHQALIGVEFLRAYPWQYLSRAFELSRVFFFKWTVNFRFLPEDVRRVWAVAQPPRCR